MLAVTAQVQIPDSELSFTFVRSGGPGGQNVNKVSSKAVLRWNFAASVALPWPVRQRFLERFGSRLTGEGELIVTSDRHRDRLRNQEDCLEKLRELLLLVATPPKPRKKTKPGKGARERRHRHKREQGEKKRERSRKSWD